MTTTKPRRAKGRVYYSTKVRGASGNYDWPVTFDIVDGYVGITQRPDGNIERVLLSPAQYKALVAFVERGEHTR
jgi:hypothetical protein